MDQANALTSVICCEGIGYGNTLVLSPIYGGTCGNSSLSNWYMLPGRNGFSVCVKQCTRYHCEAKSCLTPNNCLYNRYHTCGEVPQEWIKENCKPKLNSRHARPNLIAQAVVFALACHAMHFFLFLN